MHSTLTKNAQEFTLSYLSFFNSCSLGRLKSNGISVGIPPCILLYRVSVCLLPSLLQGSLQWFSGVRWQVFSFHELPVGDLLLPWEHIHWMLALWRKALHLCQWLALHRHSTKCYYINGWMNKWTHILMAHKPLSEVQTPPLNMFCFLTSRSLLGFPPDSDNPYMPNKPPSHLHHQQNPSQVQHRHPNPQNDY